MTSTNTFLSKIKQFELLLQKVNLSKADGTAGTDDGDRTSLAEQVQFKTNWELLVAYLSSCFVLGFDSAEAKEQFQREFMHLVSGGESADDLDDAQDAGVQNAGAQDADARDVDSKDAGLNSSPTTENSKLGSHGGVNKVLSSPQHGEHSERPDQSSSEERRRDRDKKNQEEESRLNRDKEPNERTELVAEPNGDQNRAKSSTGECLTGGEPEAAETSMQADKVNNLNNKGQFKGCKMMNKNEEKFEKCENIEQAEIRKEAGHANVRDTIRCESVERGTGEQDIERESPEKMNGREDEQAKRPENESSKGEQAGNKGDHKIDNKVGKEGDKKADGEKRMVDRMENKIVEVRRASEAKGDQNEDAKTITETENHANHKKDIKNEDKVFTNKDRKADESATTALSKPSNCHESRPENLNNEQIERQASERGEEKVKDVGKEGRTGERDGESASERDGETANEDDGVAANEISPPPSMVEDRRDADHEMTKIEAKKTIQGNSEMIEDRGEIDRETDRREIGRGEMAREQAKFEQKIEEKSKETIKRNEAKLASREDKQVYVLKRLIDRVYQEAGIQKQIQHQIELIKLDLPAERVKQTIRIRPDFQRSHLENDRKEDTKEDVEMIKKDKESRSDDQQTSSGRELNGTKERSMENIVSYQPCDVNRLTDQYFNSPQLVKVHKSLVLKVEAKGRAVYCRDELKSSTSDHLLVERPFVTWLDPSKSGVYCENCFRRLTLPIECKRCKLIAYCSEECSNSSISHRIECEYAGILAKFGPFHMATRVLMRELVWSTEETSDREFTPKTDDQINKSTRNSDPQLKSSEAFISPSLSPSIQDLANFHSLLTQVDSNSFTVLICFCLASIFTSKLLHLLYDFDSPDSERRIAVKLLKIALILKQNTMETYDEASGLSTGHALYLACALLNHACRPNCVRYFQGNHVIVRALTALPADSELTISYGLKSGLDYRERREQLKERFGFDCLCADCCKEARREKTGREGAGEEKTGKENINEEIDRETSCKEKNMKEQNGRESITKEKITSEKNTRESHEEIEGEL